MERELSPDVLCGLLAEPDRLRVFSAVVLGADVPSSIVSMTNLSAPAVANALRRLENGGLLTADKGHFVPLTGAFKDAVREFAPPAPPVEPMDSDRQRDKILHTFIRDGKLTQIPVNRAKRLVVLDHLVAIFEPGVRYPEREVNALLHAWHPDHATLRRNLVDELLLSRDAGEYWRTGGSVAL